jgi:Fur family transcriptional regulator, peroxide stress response regulator
LKQTVENFKKELTKRNIQVSYQRIKVLEYLMAKRIHPTAEQIFNDLHKEIPTLSRATVYNILKVLVKAKLVRVITIEGNETRYDIDTENHGHFKCTCCGAIYDFGVNMDSFIPDELKEFQIDDKDLYIKGICPACLLKKQQ